MRLLLVLVLLVAVGCVQVSLNNDRSKGGRGQHQDVGRVTSSEQQGNATAEIPISLIPE